MIVDARVSVIKENKQGADRMHRHYRYYSCGAQTTPPVHHHEIPPPQFQPCFLQSRHCYKALKLVPTSAHELKKIRVSDSAKSVQIRARCRNVTKWDVSAVKNMGFMFSRDSVRFSSSFDIALQRFGVALWTAVWTLQKSGVGNRVRVGLRVRVTDPNVQTQTHHHHHRHHHQIPNPHPNPNQHTHTIN